MPYLITKLSNCFGGESNILNACHVCAVIFSIEIHSTRQELSEIFLPDFRVAMDFVIVMSQSQLISQ